MSAIPAIRPAAAGDAPLIFALVSELAAFEKLSHEVRSTPEGLAAALFAEVPRVFCEIAECGDEPAGFALYFYDFSTFEGGHGLYLEDLYVRPAFRGQGVGRALLRHLAVRCQAEGLARLSWSVLDWNAGAIDFYRRHGAEMMDGWTTCRVTGDALTRLAIPVS